MKSNGTSATGSSSGLCSWERNGCFKASPPVIRFAGCTSSILRIRSKASNGVFGNCRVSGVGGLLDNFLMKRFAFSEVTKSSSESGSFPSFSEIIVSYENRKMMGACQEDFFYESTIIIVVQNLPDQYNHHLGNKVYVG